MADDLGAFLTLPTDDELEREWSALLAEFDASLVGRGERPEDWYAAFLDLRSIEPADSDFAEALARDLTRSCEDVGFGVRRIHDDHGPASHHTHITLHVCTPFALGQLRGEAGVRERGEPFARAEVRVYPDVAPGDREPIAESDLGFGLVAHFNQSRHS